MLTTAERAAYVLGAIGVLVGTAGMTYGLAHFGVPWQIPVGIVAGEIALFAPLAVILWKRRTRASSKGNQHG